MDILGNILAIEPPSILPPPPKITEIFAEHEVVVISAKEKGFTSTTSPTSSSNDLRIIDAKDTLLLRYFRRLNLTANDVYATWPSHQTDNYDTLMQLNEDINTQCSKIDESFLTTGTLSSKPA